MKKIFLFSLFTAFSLSLLSQTHWIKHPEPVLDAGLEGSWDERGVGAPCVLYIDDTLHMWYTGVSNTSDLMSIGHATSKDGFTWDKDTLNPVLTGGGEGSWDQEDVYSPHVLFLDTIYYMWYNGNDGGGERICLATSPDGRNWKKYPENPVLDVGEYGSWDANSVGPGSVYYDTVFHFWYGGREGDFFRSGYATSQDGVHWTKHPDNPFLESESEEDWDYPRTQNLTVVHENSMFHGWYSGGEILQWDIGYLSSTDGVSWVKYENNPVLEKGANGNWDEGFVAFFTVLYDEAASKFRMWYTGSKVLDGYSNKIGYAETYEPAWKQMQSMDIAKAASRSCVIDSMIYLFGGHDYAIATLNNTKVYNTGTDVWSSLASIPEDVDYSNVGVIDDKIYLAGGWQNTESGWITINSTLEYDPVANSWEVKSPVPKESGANASCVLDGKLYLFGGLKDFPDRDTSGQKDALVYDPTTDTWDSLPDMLYGRGTGASANAYNGQIYVIGGGAAYSGSESIYSGKPEKYDPGENTWTELAEMPIPVAGHVCVEYNDMLYVFGGDSSSNFNSNPQIGYCTNIIQEYDPLMDQWQIMQTMPFKRGDITGQKVGSYIYLFGGYPKNSRDFDSVLDEVWRFNLDSLMEYIDPTGISLDQESIAVEVGESLTLVATVSPSNAGDLTPIWSSGNEDIARVENGIVTGVSGGDTYIYASTSNGNFTDSCLVSVAAGIEVEVICTPSPGSDQDDMCIWLHPEDPALSTVITSDKDNTMLFVYDLNGEKLHSYSLAHKPGNIDIVYNFSLNGEPVDLVAFNARDPSPPQFVFFKVDPQTRGLVPLGSALTSDPWSDELYGFCLYRSPTNDKYYAFGCDYKSRIQQYRLYDYEGTITIEHKRTWQNGSGGPTEGMVADHEEGLLYAGNENQGIYVYKADEAETTDPVRFIPIEDGKLAGDVEGLTIYYADGGKGYLIASSQGKSYFSIFERGGENSFVRTFTISGVGDTDGIDVLNTSFNDTFTNGVFTCHNGDDSPISVNLVKWEDIAMYGSPDLLMDTTYWDPREAMPFIVDVEQYPVDNKEVCHVYPNPAEAMINIQYKGKGEYSVEITSVNGQLLLGRQAEGDAYQVDISSFRKGVYFITVRSKDFVITRKIVKL